MKGQRDRPLRSRSGSLVSRLFFRPHNCGHVAYCLPAKSKEPKTVLSLNFLDTWDTETSCKIWEGPRSWILGVEFPGKRRKLSADHFSTWLSLHPHAFISLCTIFGLSPAPVMLICSSFCLCGCPGMGVCVRWSHVCGCNATGILRWCRTQSWMMAFAFTELARNHLPLRADFLLTSYPFFSFSVCVRDPNIVNPIDLC